MQYQLIGYPLGHSLSPEIHRMLFSYSGRSAAYSLLPFAPEQLEAHLPLLKKLDGFNVTIPYKQAILPHLNSLADSAVLYGAVNTVQKSDGRYIGHNTDCYGFLQTMQAHEISLQTQVCILGVGGVGRMFAIESARQGAQITLAVRKNSLDKARLLAQELSEKTNINAKIQELDRLCGSFGLMINATPVGMYPHAGVSPVLRSVAEQADAVFDCIYNPEDTLLLQWAAAAGKRIAGGMDMLVWQAVKAHEIWYGAQFPSEEVAQIIGQMNRLLSEKRGQNA